MKKTGILVFILIFTAGCVAEPAKRVGVHLVRDSKLILEQLPESPEAQRLAAGSSGLSEYMGSPAALVRVEDFDQDLKDLKASTGLFNFFPDWLKKFLTIGGGLAGVAALFAGGHYIAGARKALAIITGSIEKSGDAATKETIAKESKGTFVANMIHRWAQRAAKVTVKNGNGPRASISTAGPGGGA